MNMIDIPIDLFEGVVFFINDRRKAGWTKEMISEYFHGFHERIYGTLYDLLTSGF